MTADRVVYRVSLGHPDDPVPDGYVDVGMWVRRDLLPEYLALMDHGAVCALSALMPAAAP